MSTAWRFTPFRAPARARQPARVRLRRQDGGDDQPDGARPGAQAGRRPRDRARHTFWYSRFGPIVNVSAAGYAWDASTAYAIGDANARNFRSSTSGSTSTARGRSTTSCARSRATRASRGSTRSPPTRAAGPSTRTTPSVPAVSRQKIDACIPAGLPQIVYRAAGVVTLDGSRPECGWAKRARGRRARHPRAPRTCRSSSGATTCQNSNDSYWLTNPKHPLTGFSPIIGTEGTELGLRTRYGLRTIANRLAGKDGLPGRKYTLARLRTLWQRDDSEAGRLLADQLAALCDAHPTVTVDGQPVDVRAACPVFRNWDATARLDSKGALAVRRLVATVRHRLLRPVRPRAAADHPEPARHQRRQRHRDRRGGEEPARPQAAARRDDAPGPVRAPARPQGADPRLLERLLPGRRGGRRSQGRDHDPGAAGALRPGRRGIEHRHAGRAHPSRSQRHDDPDLLAVRESAFAPLR